MLRALIVSSVIGVIGFSSAPTVSAELQPSSNPTAVGPPYGFESEPLSPASQQNAVRAAEEYIEMSGFSRKGLIEQLVYEGYSAADATYAVDQIAVDWNSQAVRSANDYLDMSPFSRSGLIEQLQYEGFTPSQAAYGVAVAYQ